MTTTAKAHWIQPTNIKKVMPCEACHGVETVHTQTPSGLWVCWCGAVTEAEGSDTTLRGQLEEAGFGDFGPM